MKKNKNLNIWIIVGIIVLIVIYSKGVSRKAIFVQNVYVDGHTQNYFNRCNPCSMNLHVDAEKNFFQELKISLDYSLGGSEKVYDTKSMFYDYMDTNHLCKKDGVTYSENACCIKYGFAGGDSLTNAYRCYSIVDKTANKLEIKLDGTLIKTITKGVDANSGSVQLDITSLVNEKCSVQISANSDYNKYQNRSGFQTYQDCILGIETTAYGIYGSETKIFGDQLSVVNIARNDTVIIPPVECLASETRKYTCSDNSQVNWCSCASDKWACVISPETQCVHEESENLVTNPGFESGSTGWDLRPSTGIFTFDSTIKHSGLYSMKSSPGGDGSGGFNCVLADGNNNDRSYWQSYLPKVTPGDTITLGGWVRHNGCSGEPNAPCYVGSYAAGSTIGCCSDRDGSGPVVEQCASGSKDSMSNRGGARLGIDFRNAAGDIISDCLIIYDWSMPANQWYNLEQTWIVPPNADNVIVWMQGHECNSPGTVWLDDVSLFVNKNTVGCTASEACTIDGCAGTKTCSNGLLGNCVKKISTCGTINNSCINNCGNGVCEAVYCFTTPCICQETTASCPSDCHTTTTTNTTTEKTLCDYMTFAKPIAESLNLDDYCMVGIGLMLIIFFFIMFLMTSMSNRR